ncbi:SDR family NAD(P)-dependent oxidoreductase [Aspergillus aculeatinus CBS 121060]|uniref:NAD(P)-binding protein n=1 Tax=Aspergillus aculeatinus CBS 121060 TaxID=1448322 RepID=A0ACD1HE51_9EURO|nr:NAD(P)-binding protein [Aspergillus aculeatinus CBS 121060]RAH71714.1 NAD(P)-binding protein [Aspergillus aculeatinus CBS 121060]
MALDGIAVVTGTGSGIGREIALAYAAAGAAGVALADLHPQNAEQVAIESRATAINPDFRTLVLSVDISLEESVDQMISEVVAEFGRIDYAVNSAGIGVQFPAEVSEISVSEFDAFYNVNVRGTLLFTKAVSRILKLQARRTIQGCRSGTARDVGHGCIVNIASCNSYIPTREIVQYTAAKHAVMGITKNAALDNAVHGIRVNAVCPSWVQGPMMDRVFDGNPAFEEEVLKAIPLGRLAVAEEVSEAVMFLSGPGASYITGVGLIIDGGTTLQTRT